MTFASSILGSIGALQDGGSIASEYDSFTTLFIRQSNHNPIKKDLKGEKR